ncbi:MAG: DUF711 family protein [Anaerolineales bacterium]|nr:DUF711 family protein [Anaerolineales bacterium]
MLKIRSITYFLNPEWPLNESTLAAAGKFLAAAHPAYENTGYEVQTARLATIPFPQICPTAETVEMAQAFEAAAAQQGYTYVALGPALPELPESYTVIPDVLAATENTFFSAVMATKENGISLPAVRACADVIQRAAPLDPNGFANLYFTALANVPAGSPFFPASYHHGEQPVFAIATEAAGLAVAAFRGASSLNDGVARLVATIEEHGARLAAVGEQLEQATGVPFNGIDISLAPFPAEDSSLGTALECLGIPRAGLHGSLAAAAILADAVDKAQFKRIGFNGLLLPPLEDFTLAKRAAEGTLAVTDLLMYSAVCGTGLDTIPLPGDVSAEQLSALLLDLAALAVRLDKPLTARLMPIPGKQAGDMTSFDFAFFANSRVLGLKAEALDGFFAGDEQIKIGTRTRK